MAMTECTECGKDVSNKAAACPNCGNPINNCSNNTSTRKNKKIETLLDVHPAMFRGSPKKTLFLTALVIFSLMQLFGKFEGMVSPDTYEFMTGISIFVLAATPIYLVLWKIDNKGKRLTITNESVTYRTGIIGKNTSEVRHEDVKYVEINQSALQRIFMVGTLSVASAGSGDVEITMYGLSRPGRAADLIRKHRV